MAALVAALKQADICRWATTESETDANMSPAAPISQLGSTATAAPGSAYAHPGPRAHHFCMVKDGSLITMTGFATTRELGRAAQRQGRAAG